MTAPELRDGRRRGWFWAHNAIWDVEGLSPYAILVYLYLCRCADAGGTCWPSRATIAQACRISKDSVDRAVKQLVELGLLEKEVRRANDGGYASNLYTLLDPPGADDAPAERRAHTPSRSERPPLAADSGYPLTATSGYPWPPSAATPAAHRGHPGRSERPEGRPTEGRLNEHPHPVATEDDEVAVSLNGHPDPADPAPGPDYAQPAQLLCDRYLAVTGKPLSLRQAEQIVRRYGLDYALEKLKLVAWQQANGGFDRGPRAYFLAALQGDWRLEPHVSEREQLREEERRRREEEEARREAERQRQEAERTLAAALDAAFAALPESEQATLRAEAERRVRQRAASETALQMPPLYRALVQVELRALVRERLGLPKASEGERT